MKIEIGESIILSWLRHSKNCQMVQTNWKPSMVAWEFYNDVIIEEIIENCQQKYINEKGYDLFRKNSSVSQIIQQGEIDVLGMEIEGVSISQLYAVDVAFHEAGLNYGSKEVTIAKILMKLTRMACTMLGFFDNKDGEIIFASPKINKSILIELEKEIPEINAFINKKWNLDFKFRLICNDDFDSKILQVINTLSKEVADTSELFMRSIQMYNMFNREKKVVTSKKTVAKLKIDNDTNINGYEEIKIGALVRTSFPQIIESSLIIEDELLRLCSYEYCKNNFDLNYPVLKKADERVSIIENRYENGYTRYYAKPYNILGDRYLLTSEWFERNKVYYIKWLKGIGFGDEY